MSKQLPDSNNAMAPILVRSLNRLPRDAIIDLALSWLSDKKSAPPYLTANREGFEAEEEDYLHTPASTVVELRRIYQDFRHVNSTASKRDIIDRIVDGDWRRGLSLHQYATVDFAHLKQCDKALRWSALKLVPLGTQSQANSDDNDSPPLKRRKIDHTNGLTYPQVSPKSFLAALRTEISPLVKAHYHLHRMPSPYKLTILRIYINPNSAFSLKHAKIPRRAKHAIDAGRIIYIAVPDSCPFIYISLSGSSSSTSTSTGERAKNAREVKEKALAKIDVTATKRLILEAIPKAFSRPQQRWCLDATKLVARSLKAMCELRGNLGVGSGGGAYGRFAEGDRGEERVPTDVRMKHYGEVDGDERTRFVERRFGCMDGEHYAALDRVQIKIKDVIPPSKPADADDSTMSVEEQESNEIFISFCGNDVFRGLKELAALGSEYVDLDRMPAWMTGELGISTLTV
jgi:central kinetochore subunit Mis15/CHL4